MKPTSGKLTSILAPLLFLSLLVASTGPISPASAVQVAPVEPSLHRLTLEYDKSQRQQMVDPAARTPTSADDEAEIDEFLAHKREEVDPTRITFRSGITIHPEPGMEAGVWESLAAHGDAAFDRIWLIQFRYPFPTEARYRLEKAGVEFYDYLDVCAFYAKVPAEAAPLLESMVRWGEVRFVGDVPAQAKMNRALVTDAVRTLAAERQIVVLTFDEPAPAQLAELGQWMEIERWSTGPIPIVEGTAMGASIPALAGLGYVRWVEERSEPALGNLDGGMAIGADVVREAGFNGTGVQVMVVDSGIAREGDTYHPDLQSGRILDQWDYQNDDGIAADDYFRGHGTHVAGTIGGRYSAGSPESNQSYQGVAPAADLLIYKLCCGPSQFSPSWFESALSRATSGANMANVSNNSWGGGSNVYNAYSEIADAAVLGTYNDVRVNVVAAAMNDNYYVRAPGTGKNVIAVGAVKDGNYPNAPLPYLGYGCEPYNWPPGERLCYSNYGPIDTDGDGQTRVKPDLMAPGALIRSPVPWYLPLYAGQYYGDLHGTSQATPHVTGVIAQLLDAYSDVGGGWLIDWPEMVKAMLLATAVDVGGDDDKAHYGHGLLDAYHAIYAEPGVDEPMDLWASSVSTTGETQDFWFEVPAGYEEVRVVLTWADPAVATEVVNDLDVLWVKDGLNTARGSATSLDDTVEYARIPADAAPGTWTVRIKATSLVSPTQAFALAAHVILADAALGIRATPASIPGTQPSFVPGGAFYLHQYVSNSGYTAGGSFARLSVPEGFTVTGVTVYTEDGHEHWYEASELYQEAAEGPDDYYIALGETLAGFERHVRWRIEIDEGTECGGYPFEGMASWLEGGDQQASSAVVTRVPVVCHSTYLPLVTRSY